MKTGPKPTPLAERFWPKVQKGDVCWEWLASRNNHNYGRMGRGGKHGKIELAHRIAFELTYGPIPAGIDVCHICDNPPCVRPDHLFLGTHLDNMTDMNRKGRAASGLVRARRGSQHGMSRLSEADVLAIRASKIGPTELARRYGLTRSHVSEIIHRKVWRHI